MMPMVLHAVARKAEAATPDAELLGRFIRDRDDPAFEELVRRHGPLVWAVCRQILACDADAEDAFQAVFLTLARSATHIRDSRAVSAWLHGAAVRVATRARRGIARRQVRERRAAVSEVDRPVSDVTWGALIAAVHEEVQRLPNAERTAFVLCDLQGVSQADAAARLGWALGSVSARLCKARQHLLARLVARGVAPAAIVGIGITAGAASAVPATLFDKVKRFSTAPLAASSGAAALARGLTEGITMRVKLVAVATVVVAAVGLTGGAVWMSKADAQPTAPNGGSSLGPPSGGNSNPGSNSLGPKSGGLGNSSLGPTTGGNSLLGGSSLGSNRSGLGNSSLGPPSGGGTASGIGLPSSSTLRGGNTLPADGMQPRADGNAPVRPGGGVAAPGWEHKFVDVKNDRKEFEKVITQQGKDGWEFCSSERFAQGDLVLVFKKRKGDSGGTGGSGNLMTPRGRFGDNNLGRPAGGDEDVKPAPADNAVDPNRPARPAPGRGGTGSPMGGPPAGASVPASLTIFTLKHAKATEMAEVLKKVFAPQGVEVTADPRTNRLIVRSDDDTIPAVKRIVEQLDVDVPK